MAPDYRSDRMESPEGKGIARRAWDGYSEAVKKASRKGLVPVMTPAAQALAREHVADLIGFWALWHLYGGFEGLQAYGFHRATIYRKIKRFRNAFGVHPDEYEFPGIAIDASAYWASAEKKVGPRPKT